MPHSPQQIRFCTSRDGTRIAYATCGQGPLLLWAPHWSHHLDLDWDSPIWRHWLTLLTKRYTVIRHDWRGCGLSDRDGVEFSVEKYIEDFEAVVDAAGLDRFPLVGVSNGAIFGAAYTARHPDRVTHLVLNECQGRGRLGSDPSPEQVEGLHAWLKVIEFGWPNPNLAYGQFFTSLHLSDASVEHRQAFHDLAHQTTSAATVIGLVKTFARADLRQILPQIRCPTLVLHSRGDSLIPFEEGRTAAALIPGARFIPLESRNHIVTGTEPAWQQIADAIEAFLPMPASRTGSAQITLLKDLTARENQVLELLAQGLDNDTIAKKLGIGKKTVRNQVSIIFSKLGVDSRAQAIVRARNAGFGSQDAGS
jgi:pimeloyl-ACP methyl ester carboxylesterase/DNA-binding CsgD family transcriptional regulator